MDIQYRIEFFSNWHCGSGQAAGADVDALVVKDADGLPFVPGRTVKGLLKEAAEQLEGSPHPLTDRVFGRNDETGEDSGDTQQSGIAFFGNAVLVEKDAIVQEKLSEFLYQRFSTTAIDERSGTAKDKSLRRIETVVPCTLRGEILDVPDEARVLLGQAMLLVKRMGTGRNRGYGRCRISPINE